MSAIASFIKIPASALENLRRVAVPEKRFFRAPKNEFNEYVRAHGREVVQYGWSGYVLFTLLVYLRETHDLDLEKSEHSQLAEFLSQARGSTHIILTPAQKDLLVERLDPQFFAEEELRHYFNEFNAAVEDYTGRAMLDGIIAIRESLRQSDDNSVILLIVG